jgi:hypothetical protein
MASKDKECKECWYAHEHIKFRDELLGKLPQGVTSEGIREAWESKGWLSSNGICRFPMDVQAHPTGVITRYPISWWKNASEDDVNAAIDAGDVIFVDGNGKRYTLSAYRIRYPNYPNPLYVLRVAKRFPPNPNSYVDLEDKEVQKEWTKYIFRSMI